nr:unnamed protein product [Digitaria exilis]
MDQDGPGRRRRRRRQHRRSGEDFISSLPDEILRSILLRLGSVRAAASTSVLSRRWRHVWAHLPELVSVNNTGHDHDVRPLLDTVDAALAAYADPTLEALVVVLSTAYADGLGGVIVTARRVAPWLRFAAERVAGELVVFEPPPMMPPSYVPELELPACPRAKTIALRIDTFWRLPVVKPPSGVFVFTALTSLTMFMAGGEVTDLVSTRCPCLRNLRLCLTIVNDHDVSIRSVSLHTMSLRLWGTRRLEVVAASLENLYLCNTIDER